MDTSISLSIALLMFPLVVGLQTYWIARGLNRVGTRLERVDTRLDRMDDRLDRLTASTAAGLDGIRAELHAHEVACQERNKGFEIRLDRLERN